MSYPFIGVEALENRQLLAAGDLDPTFGSGGKFVADLDTGPGLVLPGDLAVQPDGKILYLGSVGVFDVAAVVRLNANGTLDTGFGSGGLAKSGFGPYQASASALAVGPGGKIAVAGFAGPYDRGDTTPLQSTLVVYDSSGKLDKSFGGGDGILNLPQFPRGFTDVIFQTDGKLVALGEKTVRYNANGSIDTSFGGGDGIADVGGKEVLIDSNGKIVVLGQFALFRLNANGTPDNSFDGDGVRPNVKGTDIDFAPDGDILVAGNGAAGELVTRFNPNGSVDTAFGSNGSATVFAGRRIAVTGSNIFVGGTQSSPVTPWDQFEFTALTLSGKRDASYGNNGSWTTALSPTRTRLVDLEIQQGKLLALGSTDVQAGTATVQVPAVTRYQLGTATPIGQQPYDGVPINILNGVGVGFFDKGGEGVAYHDTDGANLGGVLRPTEGVDIQSGGASRPYVVGFVKAGEWLEYTVDVPTSGKFDLDFSVSHLKNGGRFHLEVDGQNVTGSLAVPNTGNWNTYRNVTKAGVSLTAGRHVLRLAFDAAGDLGYVGNFDRIVFRPTDPQAGQGPYFPAPAKDGDRVESENFDKGGEGVAYHDLEPSAFGDSPYRLGEGVDLQNTTDTGGGVNVGFIRAGEWLEYTMDFTQSGPFDLNVRAASQGQSGTFRVLVDGQVVATFSMNGAGWQSYQTLKKTGVNVAAGRHVVRFEAVSVGATGYTANLNWFEFKKA
jgi:uncharacterized delta-60 repeat protein